MTDMAKYPGLMRRGTKWYLRTKIPADLVDEVGRREIWRSLNTGNYKKAVGRYKMALAEVEALKEAARRRLRGGNAEVSDAELRGLVAMWFHSNDNQMAEADHGLFEDDRRKALWNMIEDGDVLQNGAEEEWARSVQDQADTLLEVAGIVLDKADTRYRNLSGYVRRAMLEEVRRSQSRLSGRSAGEVFDTLFATYGAGKHSSKAENKSRSDPTLSDLVEQFLDDPSSKRGQHAVDDYRVVLRFLSEFVDSATAVSLVGREHCRKMVMLLRRMPANASKKKALRGLSPIKAADLAERLGIPPMSTTTANSYISKMSALFRWAVREGLLDHNPAEGLLLPEVIHKRDARRPFSTDQINTILGSEVFRIPVEAWDHRQWVFLLGLYGGLRLNEACGLTCDDVAKHEGVACLLVRPDDTGRKRLKSRAARREVPVHPILQKLGLLEFVERRRKAGHAVLFPDLKLDRRGYLSDGYQKWFARHLRNIGATAPRTSFHSTRHCFRDALREIAAPRDVVLALGGWAGNGGTEDNYGSGLRTKTLALWIRKINYGIDIDWLWKALDTIPSS